mgnify:FL=1
MAAAVTKQSREIPCDALSGWGMLVVNLSILVIGIGLIISGNAILPGILLMPIAVVMLGGHFTLQPNEARVLILFGDYKGTVRSSGFFWANPFYSRSRGGPVVQVQIAAEVAKASTPGNRSQLHSRNSTKVSLRAQTLNGERLKVNDKGGNPIEIAAIVIWRVDDTARALFDVEDHESYVSTQTESALRHLASQYAYDHGEIGRAHV